MSAAPIEKPALIERLGDEDASHLTVVTPNRRLARALAREVDRVQLGRGRRAWPAADILPLDAFQLRAYEEALASDAVAPLPRLISEPEELLLWSRVIAASERGAALLALDRTAEAVAASWRLAHDWGIEGALGAWPGGEDAEAFAEWSRGYVASTRRENLVDRARLPRLVAGVLAARGVLRLPRVLVRHGFELVTPLDRDFFAACAGAGVEVRDSTTVRAGGSPRRAAFRSSREEIEAAAAWARDRLERGAGGVRIGVVVPDLAGRRAEVARVFARVMGEEHGRARDTADRPFGLSLGEPLAGIALVQAALSVLSLATGEIDYLAASRLLRSPFLGGAEAERDLRARLDARLGRTGAARLTLARLTAAIDAPLLRARLVALVARVRAVPSGPQPASFWARTFGDWLVAAGFPGERTLDSNEYQAREKWNATLAEFAATSRLAGRLAAGEALDLLRGVCRRTLFQPGASGEPPVEVLGILESAGLEFDHLWVSGLVDEAWPLAPRPDPFVPRALQRKAGVPQADPATALEFDRRITTGWAGAAGEVVFSHALRDRDRDLAPSTLIADVPEGNPEFAREQRWRDAIHASSAFESLADGVAPPLAEVTLRGGTRVLADQSACPFRAFARHRLGARSLETPEEGVDARVRGELVHALMAAIWREARSSEALANLDPLLIDRAAQAAVAEAGIEGRFARIERERLAGLARDWLAIERERPAFEVVEIEAARAIAVGPLMLRGRIDRLDRVLEGPGEGSHVLIDYKTGSSVSIAAWRGERPDDPQLPIYALTAPEDIGAVAFAHFRAGTMALKGVERDPGTLPPKRATDDWAVIREQWASAAESLAGGFARGDAKVDPKDRLKTCEHCDLAPMCRVHERLAAVDSDEERAGE